MYGCGFIGTKLVRDTEDGTVHGTVVIGIDEGCDTELLEGTKRYPAGVI